MRRGELWWAELPEPRGAEPAYRRPVLVVQNNDFTSSRLRTVIVAGVTGRVELREAAGNVFVPEGAGNLPRDSVVNVSQVFTLEKAFLHEPIGRLPDRLLRTVDAGLKLALDL